MTEFTVSAYYIRSTGTEKVVVEAGEETTDPSGDITALTQKGYQIPRVCRQIYAETHVLLYNKTLFVCFMKEFVEPRGGMRQLSPTQIGAIRTVLAAPAWVYAGEDIKKAFPSITHVLPRSLEEWRDLMEKKIIRMLMEP